MSERPVIRVYIGRNLIIEEQIVTKRIEIGEELSFEEVFEGIPEIETADEPKEFSNILQDCAGNILELCSVRSDVARELNLCRECLISEVGDGYYICKDCLDLQYLEDISYDRLEQGISLE